MGRLRRGKFITIKFKYSFLFTPLMGKEGVLFFGFLLVVLLLISIVSAGAFTGIWAKMHGNIVATDAATCAKEGEGCLVRTCCEGLNCVGSAEKYPTCKDASFTVLDGEVPTDASQVNCRELKGQIVPGTNGRKCYNGQTSPGTNPPSCEEVSCDSISVVDSSAYGKTERRGFLGLFRSRAAERSAEQSAVQGGDFPGSDNAYDKVTTRTPFGDRFRNFFGNLFGRNNQVQNEGLVSSENYNFPEDCEVLEGERVANSESLCYTGNSPADGSNYVCEVVFCSQFVSSGGGQVMAPVPGDCKKPKDNCVSECIKKPDMLGDCGTATCPFTDPNGNTLYKAFQCYREGTATGGTAAE